jgi:hypothetical protein
MTALSFTVFALFDWLYNHHGTPAAILFGVWTIVSILSILMSCFCWPDEPYLQPVQVSNTSPQKQYAIDEYRDDETRYLMLEHPVVESETLLRDNDALFKNSCHITSSSIELVRDDEDIVGLKNERFYVQLTSATFVRAVLFLLVTCLFANFYIASVSTEVSNLRLSCAVLEDLFFHPFLLCTACRLAGLYSGRPTQPYAKSYAHYERRHALFFSGRVSNGSVWAGGLRNADYPLWYYPARYGCNAWQSPHLDGWKLYRVCLLSTISVSCVHCKFNIALGV